jgi:hypothetical protein
VAIGFVQSAGGNTGAAANIATSAFSSATTLNNLIVVTANGGGTANAITSVTDTALNTYSKVFSIAFGSAVSLDVWYATGIAVVGSNVVTGHRASGAAGTLVAAEYSGIAISSPADVFVTGTASSNASAASGSTATTVMASELVVGGVGSGLLGTTSATLGAGYTNLAQQSVSGNFVAQESKVVSAIGTQSAAFTLNVADYWVCGCVTFRGAIVPLNRYLAAPQAVMRSYVY